MNIHIQTIPHNQQKYPTVGDYFETPDSQEIRVSEMGDWRYEFLVALHEMIELALVTEQGIKIEDIETFDKKFEKEREAGLHAEDEEPGDDPGAPYHEQHVFAECLERMAALKLKVDWNHYTKTVMGL
jgi:hypothetical protein